MKEEEERGASVNSFREVGWSLYPLRKIPNRLEFTASTKNSNTYCA